MVTRVLRMPWRDSNKTKDILVAMIPESAVSSEKARWTASVEGFVGMIMMCICGVSLPPDHGSCLIYSTFLPHFPCSGLCEADLL
eukprot:2206934-Amphidinium_carterae.1